MNNSRDKRLEEVSQCKWCYSKKSNNVIEDHVWIYATCNLAMSKLRMVLKKKNDYVIGGDLFYSKNAKIDQKVTI